MTPIWTAQRNATKEEMNKRKHLNCFEPFCFSIEIKFKNQPSFSFVFAAIRRNGCFERTNWSATLNAIDKLTVSFSNRLIFSVGNKMNCFFSKFNCE